MFRLPLDADRDDIPDFDAGDTVKVHVKVTEGNRERVQVFEGIVIRSKKGGIKAAITVRKVSHGVGVERIFPFASPSIVDIKVNKRGRVRRAKLFYLRNLVGKKAKIREKRSLNK